MHCPNQELACNKIQCQKRRRRIFGGEKWCYRMVWEVRGGGRSLLLISFPRIRLTKKHFSAIYPIFMPLSPLYARLWPLRKILLSIILKKMAVPGKTKEWRRHSSYSLFVPVWGGLAGMCSVVRTHNGSTREKSRVKIESKPWKRIEYKSNNIVNAYIIHI